MTQVAKVSIVIPVYNGADYLDDAIQSALHQTYRNIEILVVNDGSNDNGATEQIVRKYEDRIRYFEKLNGGVASALNLAVEKMTGDYFSWLSHDDLYVPEKIEAQLSALHSCDSRTVSYCDYSVFEQDWRKSIPVTINAVPPSEFRYWLTTNNILHGCTLLIPRAAFKECGAFSTDLRTTQDYDLWFRMAERFQFVHLPRVLVLARSHPNQDSKRKASMAKRECNQLLIRFARGLSESEILGPASPDVFPRRFADLSASMFRRRFFQAGVATIPIAMSRLHPKGVWFVIVYLVLFPLKAFFSMWSSLLSALLRKVMR